MLREVQHRITTLPLFFQILITSLPLSVLGVLVSGQILYSAIFIVPIVTYIAIYHLQVLFYLLVFTIPLSINVDISSSLTTDFPDELIMWCIFPLVIFLVLAKPQLLPAKFWNTPIITMFTLLFFWALVATIFSTSLVPSVKYLLAKLWYIASFVILAFLVFRDVTSIFRTFKIFMISFSLFLLYALYQQYLVGFVFEEVNYSVMPFYRNHVNFSATIAVIVPLVVLWMVQTKKLSSKLGVFLYLLIILAGLYFAYGRAAWLSVIAALIMVPIIKMKLVKPTVVIAFLLLGFAVYWIIDEQRYMEYKPDFENTYMRDNIADHIVATFQGSDVSSMERVHRWIGSVRMSQEYPVFGVGPNNFYENYRRYVITDFRTWVSRNMDRSTSHNYFLIMLTEQGFVAMFLYAILIFVSLAYGQRLYFRSDNILFRRVAMAVTCALTAFYVNNFLSELIETDELGSLFYLLSVTLVALDLYQAKFENLFPDTSIES